MRRRRRAGKPGCRRRPAAGRSGPASSASSVGARMRRLDLDVGDCSSPRASRWSRSRRPTARPGDGLAFHRSPIDLIRHDDLACPLCGRLLARGPYDRAKPIRNSALDFDGVVGARRGAESRARAESGCAQRRAPRSRAASSRSTNGPSPSPARCRPAASTAREAERHQGQRLERPAGHLAAHRDRRPVSDAASWTTKCSSLSTGGDKRVVAVGERGLPRSAANRNCIRSLVPTETKSSCGSRRRGARPAPAPRTSRQREARGRGRPRRCAQSSSWSSSARGAGTRSTSAISGNMTDSGRPRAARISARSCRRSIAGRSRPDADRPPAHAPGCPRLGRQVGQHLVAADIERAEGHRPVAGRVQHAAVERGLRIVVGKLRDHELELGAEEADALGAGLVEMLQVDQQARVHEQA